MLAKRQHVVLRPGRETVAGVFHFGCSPARGGLIEWRLSQGATVAEIANEIQVVPVTTHRVLDCLSGFRARKALDGA
jgi:hypothetical protein